MTLSSQAKPVAAPRLRQGAQSPEREDPPRTRQSPRTLAAFRPWGGWRDNAVRGVIGQCSQLADQMFRNPVSGGFR